MFTLLQKQLQSCCGSTKQRFTAAVPRLTGKDPNAGKDWRQNDKGAAKDVMVRAHDWLYGHESEQTWEIVKDRGAWHVEDNGAANSLTQLSNWTTAKNKLKSQENSAPHSESGIKASSLLQVRAEPPKRLSLLPHCSSRRDICKIFHVHPRRDSPNFSWQPMARVVTWLWRSK